MKKKPSLYAIYYRWCHVPKKDYGDDTDTAVQEIEEVVQACIDGNRRKACKMMWEQGWWIEDVDGNSNEIASVFEARVPYEQIRVIAKKMGAKVKNDSGKRKTTR